MTPKLPRYAEIPADPDPPSYHSSQFREMLSSGPKHWKHYRSLQHCPATNNLRDFLYYIICKDYGLETAERGLSWHTIQTLKKHIEGVPLLFEEISLVYRNIIRPATALGIHIEAVLAIVKQHLVHHPAKHVGFFSEDLHCNEKIIIEKIRIDWGLVIPVICTDTAQRSTILNGVLHVLKVCLPIGSKWRDQSIHKITCYLDSVERHYKGRKVAAGVKLEEENCILKKQVRDLDAKLHDLQSGERETKVAVEKGNFWRDLYDCCRRRSRKR